MTAPNPEVTARLKLVELMRAEFATAPKAGVTLGPPVGDAGTRNVWVGGVDNAEDHRGLRGEEGPSVLQRFVARVHVDVADEGATPEEVTTAVWAMVGRVRAAVRAQTRGSTFGDGIQGSPKVVRTASDGPVPMADGGHAEQVLVEIQFTARI